VLLLTLNRPERHNAFNATLNHLLGDAIRATRGAARPGEHSIAILQEVGLNPQQIEDLIARGVVATGPAPDD
jgi:crotonobetainyl-CoA:carnitine CoA-transferase CaiB-like acyl-CoA transferase